MNQLILVMLTSLRNIREATFRGLLGSNNPGDESVPFHKHLLGATTDKETGFIKISKTWSQFSSII